MSVSISDGHRVVTTEVGYDDILDTPDMVRVIRHCLDYLGEKGEEFTHKQTMTTELPERAAEAYAHALDKKLEFVPRRRIEIPLNRKCRGRERYALEHYFRHRYGWIGVYYYLSRPDLEPFLHLDNLCPKL